MGVGFDKGRARLTAGGEEDPRAVERRIWRDMCAAVAVAVAVSVFVAPWRVTTGLLLGGVLALFNFHWLRASVRSVFGGAPAGARPQLGATRYVLRYLVVASVIAAAHALGLVSLVAALVGMCAFVPAALAEGFRQLYSSFTAREDA